MKTSNLANLM